MTIGPRTAFFTLYPCALVSYHAPTPIITEHHHRQPMYLQMKLWGEVRLGPNLWVCSNCHESVHAWLYWLLGERAQPATIGRAAKAEAERTFAWYMAEKGTP